MPLPSTPRPSDPTVLMAFDWDLNPLVSLLISGMEKAGYPIRHGTASFWDPAQPRTDIVHIQWPESLFGWRMPSQIELLYLVQRLEAIKKHATIVHTKHNWKSHHIRPETQDALESLYRIIDDASDVIVHLGENSRQAAEACPELKSKHHAVIPIHVYDGLYGEQAARSRPQVRRSMGLPSTAFYQLVFGNLRYSREKELVTRGLQALPSPRPITLAPQWNKPLDYAFSPRHPMLALRSLTPLVQNRIMNLRVDCLRKMPDERVGDYFSCSEVLFLQRTYDLNSGNIPMAFLFEQVVAGTRHGNIGYWLEQTGNPVFDPDDPESVSQALQRAMILAKDGHGKTNKEFAMDHWRTEIVVQQHISLYRDIA